MLFELADDDPRPLAEQLAASVREAIVSGTAPSGTRLPSGRDVAAAVGASLQTVQRAYQILGNEGLVVSRVGRGTVIAPDIDVERLSLLDDVDRLVTAARRRNVDVDELITIVRSRAAEAI